VSESAKRAAIKAVLLAVSNIGNVYDYERWAAFASGQDTIGKATISGSDVIRFWTISCSACRASLETFGNTAGLVTRSWVYTIKGAFGLDDSAATEKTAIALIEAVMDALDASETVHPPSDLTNGSEHPAQMRLFENRFFTNGALCHYVELEQVVTEQT